MNNQEIKRELTIALSSRLDNFRKEYDQNATMTQVSIKREKDNIYNNYSMGLNEEFKKLLSTKPTTDEEFEHNKSDIKRINDEKGALKKLIDQLEKEAREGF